MDVPGGERRQVMILLFATVYLAYILTLRFGMFVAVPVCGVVWLLGMAILRRMATSDPQMWAVLKRARKYKGFYPARGRFDAPQPQYRDYK
ncbi:VirB3 family type IV secretion system protein [Cupriavidus sp. D39]|nr:VirB3 family type IV secretion system protein [Cupriavidus sp. D39]